MYRTGNCVVRESSRTPSRVAGVCTSGEKRMLFNYEPKSKIFYTMCRNGGLVKENELSVMTKAADEYLRVEGLKS